MREAELFAENKGLADRDHRRAEDHIVANLRGLTVTRIAAMYDALAHPLQNRLAARESFRGAADHESQSRGLGAGDPTRDRRIKRRDATLRGKRMRGPRTGHIDGRAVDKQRAAFCRGQYLAPDRPHMFAGGQHGNDDIGFLHACLRVWRDFNSGLRGFLTSGRDDVKADDRVARFDQIGSHRCAHIAKADEPDVWHGASLAFEFEFEFPDRSEMTVDDVARDRFDFIWTPARIAVFVDDCCANAFKEIVPGDARQGDTVILLKALLNLLECRRRPDIAQRHFE